MDRKIHDVLEEWRDVERELDVCEDEVRRAQLTAQRERSRAELQALFESKRTGNDTPQVA